MEITAMDFMDEIFDDPKSLSPSPDKESLVNKPVQKQGMNMMNMNAHTAGSGSGGGASAINTHVSAA